MLYINSKTDELVQFSRKVFNSLTVDRPFSVNTGNFASLPLSVEINRHGSRIMHDSNHAS